MGSHIQSDFETPEQFLATGDTYRLGELLTEQAHPQTLDLSEWAVNDLPRAVESLAQLDRDVAVFLLGQTEVIGELADAVVRARLTGGRVFLSGCGATGRLSLTLESLVRRGAFPGLPKDAVIAFMAGGDTALVRSIERFEDHPEYGARQLLELGFGPQDLLIAITEGGETPFVVGTVEEALRQNTRPWLVYCNPTEVLCAKVERSRVLLEDAKVARLPLVVGPMGLTGSTRMQASTVQMLAVGWALKAAGCGGGASLVREQALAWQRAVDAFPFAEMLPFIVAESEHYAAGGYLSYFTDDFGMTVLTDTTERSPTFSLCPFENLLQPEDPLSLSYLFVNAPDVVAAWQQILLRPARALDWDGLPQRVRLEGLYGFDVSKKGAELRIRRIGDRHYSGVQGIGDRQYVSFRVVANGGGFSWQLLDHQWDWSNEGLDMLSVQVLLKQALNIHSTLVMGRLGRYEGNLMTYVRPSNGKLIDRAARYVQILCERRKGCRPHYADAVRAVFVARENLGADEPVVLKALGGESSARH